MAYRESLDYLYGLQRFGIKLGLDNVRRLLGRATNPQEGMSLVHVAGTNGKGSVCVMLAAFMQKAGLCTGLYTSPHLHAFNERIRVNGMEISDTEIVDLTERLKSLCADDIPATFFEFTTAMALCHFRDKNVDWGILETGMGGRLDATNAVTPVVSVITSVALDHEEHLGSGLAAVAGEKAGVIKPGIPVVSASQPEEVAEVLAAKAAELGAPLYVSGQDFSLMEQEEILVYRGVQHSCPSLTLPLAGAHQRENLSLALAALELSGQWETLGCEAVSSGLQEVSWPGRLEWWPNTGERKVLLDGAHNLAACQALSAYLKEFSTQRVHLVFGTKADKSSVQMLKTMLSEVETVLLVEPPVEEPAPREELAALVSEHEKPVRLCADVGAALDGAFSNCRDDDVVVVAGSLFLVAAAREALWRR